MATHLNETDARTITVLFGCNLTLAAVLAVILPVASVHTFLAISPMLLLEPLVRMPRTADA